MLSSANPDHAFHGIQSDNDYLLFDSRHLPDCRSDCFEPAYWQQRNAITGESFGRGTTWFFRQGQGEYVLRHYRRGGMIGRINRDRYLYTGTEQTRAVREFRLLASMHAAQLPVPAPVACRVRRDGAFYTADLIIERIPASADLVHLLVEQALDEQTWHRAGQLVARFHQAGIWHADLNAHNILRDADGKLWLIDFDRGQQRTPASRWQQANLDRLLRSLRKEQIRLPVFHWDETRDWPALLKGYQSQA